MKEKLSDMDIIIIFYILHILLYSIDEDTKILRSQVICLKDPYHQEEEEQKFKLRSDFQTHAFKKAKIIKLHTSVSKCRSSCTSTS